jgi:hypothetical protein
MLNERKERSGKAPLLTSIYTAHQDIILSRKLAELLIIRALPYYHTKKNF